MRLQFLRSPLKKALFLLLLKISFSVNNTMAQMPGNYKPGVLDSSFSGDGKTISDVSDNYSVAYSAAIQSNGKIIVAGSADYNFMVVRYKANGRIDANFGLNGKIKIGAGDIAEGNTLAIQTDDKIVVGGDNSDGLVVFRLTPVGKRDSSFGVNGVAQVNFSGLTFGYSLALQQNGKILMAGRTDVNGQSHAAIVRFNVNGTLDSSFGTNGVVIADYSDVHSIAVQTDGKILAGGGYYSFLLARYKKNGSLDSTFGKNGITTTDFGQNGGSNRGLSIALQPDGRIVFLGKHGNIIAMARYKPNGHLDSTFGKSGKVLTNVADYSDFSISCQPESVALTQNEKIVVGGYIYGSGPTVFSLLQYNSKGQLDKKFGTAGTGIVTTEFYSSAAGEGIAIQPNGKIILVGNAENSSNTLTSFAIARYFGDSSLINKTNNYALLYQSEINSIVPVVPNPVKDVLLVQNLSPNNKIISVINSEGKLMQQITSSDKNVSLNIKQLEAGLYFVRINEDKKTTTIKFIKE